MKKFLLNFSNSEVAFLFWFILIVFVCFWQKTVREPLKEVFLAFFSKTFLPFYFVLVGYFLVIIQLFKYSGLWEFALYKDFLFWLTASGMVMFFKLSNVDSYGDLRGMVIKVLPFTLIIDYLIGFYSFSLLVELILLPFLTFLSFLYLGRSNEAAYLIARNILKIIGLVILLHFLHSLLTSYQELLTLYNLKAFLLPLILTFLFMPLMLLVVLYSKYENLFQQLDRYNFVSNKRKWAIKASLLFYANANFRLIKKGQGNSIYKY